LRYYARCSWLSSLLDLGFAPNEIRHERKGEKDRKRREDFFPKRQFTVKLLGEA